MHFFFRARRRGLVPNLDLDLAPVPIYRQAIPPSHPLHFLFSTIGVRGLGLEGGPVSSFTPFPWVLLKTEDMENLIRVIPVTNSLEGFWICQVSQVPTSVCRGWRTRIFRGLLITTLSCVLLFASGMLRRPWMYL